MTAQAVTQPKVAQRSKGGKVLPVVVVVLFIVVIWYVAAIFLNAPWQRQVFSNNGVESWTTTEFIQGVYSQDRPVLPAPHQVVEEIWNTTVKKKITSKRSLIYHARITLSSALLGFFIGTLLGIALASAILFNKSLERSLMPWIIASQTIPILAIAPMIIVVLNAVGIQGLLPKAFISAYLSFFPVAVGMVKGLRSPDRSYLDLMQTYNASPWQTFWKLRMPAAVPFLFASMKVAIAISMVGAIVGELPTGAVAGLGARLLAGSYYGQTVQIWSALVVASVLAALLVGLVELIDKWLQTRMGYRT